MQRAGRVNLVEQKDTALRDREIHWVGPTTFEERCNGSLQTIQRIAPGGLEYAIPLAYPIVARPKKAATEMRSIVGQRTDALLAQLLPKRSLEHCTVDPYRMSSLRSALARATNLAHDAQACLVVDVTCLTRIHALAISSWLAYGQNQANVFLAYTEGARYGDPARHRSRLHGWRDVVVAPLLLDPLQYSEDADAIVSLGHEGVRLDLALRSITPDFMSRPNSGVILSWEPRQREVYVVAETENARLLRKVETGQFSEWLRVHLDYGDQAGLDAGVTRFCERRAHPKRRVVFYPFGPKMAIVVASLAAIREVGTLLWFSYPKRSWYPVDYTVGVGKTHWYQVDRVA